MAQSTKGRKPRTRTSPESEGGRTQTGDRMLNQGRSTTMRTAGKTGGGSGTAAGARRGGRAAANPERRRAENQDVRGSTARPTNTTRTTAKQDAKRRSVRDVIRDTNTPKGKSQPVAGTTGGVTRARKSASAR